MKKYFVVPALSILSCIPLTSQAWCGPYVAPYPAPMWGGGYAPAFVPPPYPVYAPPYAPPFMGRHWGGPGYAAPGYAAPAPWGQGPDDFYADDSEGPSGENSLTDTESQRKQAMDAAKSRRAAFRARTEARQAEIKARRDAWRQQMEKMGVADGYQEGAVMSQDSIVTERQPEPVSAQLPSTPAEQPKTSAATNKP